MILIRLFLIKRLVKISKERIKRMNSNIMQLAKGMLELKKSIQGKLRGAMTYQENHRTPSGPTVQMSSNDGWNSTVIEFK